MGKINVNGKVITFTAADATNNIIMAGGKYYQKGPKGYREIKENGKSIFDAAAKKSAEAKKNAQAAANYNKKNGFEPNKKYYVVGNSSYFTMVDNNYNTLYYKDNQRITKEQFQKGANCVYDAKSKRYIARDAKNVSHKYAQQFRQTVKDSKTGRYFVEIKGGQRKYFEANGKEISERAFLDIEKAYIDSDGKIAKYDWWAKTKNAAKGIGNMFADMVTEEAPVYQKDKNGKILLDQKGQPIVEKNKDGSPKTNRKFSLSRTCTTVLVGGAIATVCVLAAPVAAAGAAAAGIGAGAAATIGSVVGLTTQLGIAGYFGYEGGKQMYNANEENKNVLLSNNERMENWKKKGAGGAQVGMSLMMAKGAVKNAPKTHATARNTAKAIETKNNATLMAKGKVGLRDRISNTRSGFSETVGWKALKKGVGDYHKNNSLKTKVADVAKAPLKLTKEAIMEPIRLATGTVKGGAKLVTKKGRAKIKGDIKEWKNSFKENPQNTPALTPEQVKAQQEANAKFKQSLADMPKENKVQQYESLIEKTTDKNQVAQLLDAIKNDKDLTKAQKAEVATKFFEKNDAQYPGVLDAGKRQKAELGLDKAKTLEDIKKVDREALPAKKQKVFDKKKAEFEKKEIKKASLDELKQMDREALTEEGKAALDKRIEKLEKKAQKAENGGSFYDNRVKPAIDGAKAKVKSLFKRKAKTNESAQNVEQNAQQATEPKVSAEFEQEVSSANPTLKTKTGKTLQADVVEANVKASVEGLIKKAKNKAELEAINAKLDKMAGDKTITKAAREVILKQKDLVNAAIKKLNRQNSFVGRTITKVKNGFNKVKDAVTSKAKGKIKTEPQYVEPNFDGLIEYKDVNTPSGYKKSTFVNKQGETVYTKEVYDYGSEVIRDAKGREIYSTNTRIVLNSGETCMSETRTTYDANGLKYKEYVTEYKADGKTVDLKYTEKFDQKGNCIEYATDNGKQVYEYNENGQIIKETKTGFDLAKGEKKVTTYEYDAQGYQVRRTDTIGNDVAITDMIRKNDGTERYITSRKGVVERVWESNNDGSTDYYYSKDGKLNMVYGKNQINIKYLEDGKIELTEWIDHKPQTSTISMAEFKAKYGDFVEAPKVEAAKPVTEKPKTEAQPEAEVKPDVEPEPKTMNSENSFAKFEDMIAKSDDMSQVRAKLSNNLEFNKLSQAEQRQLIAKINQREIEIVDMKNTFAKFEDMIAKADDLSKVQAKLSNNPEFNKLSNADKLKLLEKLNKRKAELEVAASKSAQKEAPKNEPKTSKTGYSNNLFGNVKDMKTPTLGGLNAVKSVDENVVKPLEDALNSTLDPNQQYAYAELPAQDDYIEEESSEVDSENEVVEEPPVQESGDQEEVANPEDNSDVENPEESGNADETNQDDASNNIKDSEDAPASEPEQETEPPVTEPQTPATEQKDGGNAPAAESEQETEPPVIEPQTPAAEHKDGGSAQAPSAPTTPKTNTPDGNTKGDSSVAPEQPAPAQSDKANDSKKVEDSKNDTVGQVDGEKKKDNAVQENSQEEPDIPQNKKLEITKKVQEANTDDDIGNVLRELREVGRFKGRKNLRRLLKAKRKYNKELAENDVKKADKYQERVEKYKERVKDNINEINEAYRKKLED